MKGRKRAGAGPVFIDSTIFVLDLSHDDDPRTPISRKFLDLMRRTGRGATTLVNVFEAAGSASFHSPEGDVVRLVHGFASRYAVRVWPDMNRPLILDPEPLVARLSLRMKFPDAAVLLLVEEHPVEPSAFVTWNVKHFVGRTEIPVMTPQQYLRGKR